MWYFTLSLLVVLGAGAVYLVDRLRKMGRGDSPALNRRFQELEERVKSLKSSGKIPDPLAALDRVAEDLHGPGLTEKLQQIRQTRQKLVQANAQAPSGAERFEGSLVIPKVFRDPDPDLALAKIFYDLGAKSKKFDLELKIALGIVGVAGVAFVANVIARFTD